jgi:hypothetical protein
MLPTLISQDGYRNCNSQVELVKGVIRKCVSSIFLTIIINVAPVRVMINFRSFGVCGSIGTSYDKGNSFAHMLLPLTGVH